MKLKVELTQLNKWVEHYSKLYAEESPEHLDLESVLPSFDLFVEEDEDPTEEELSEAITLPYQMVRHLVKIAFLQKF